MNKRDVKKFVDIVTCSWIASLRVQWKNINERAWLRNSVIKCLIATLLEEFCKLEEFVKINLDRAKAFCNKCHLLGKWRSGKQTHAAILGNNTRIESIFIWTCPDA